uniref:Peptidase S1 domain-containing protein n=1 Tax=Timema monikensis TaxID=170555 RepID=A0A7R9EKW7_9NEOP|nr:unnamed protein product [Timema monikensis]
MRVNILRCEVKVRFVDMLLGSSGSRGLEVESILDFLACLSTPIIFDNFQQPIPLAKSGQFIPKDTAVRASGWGYISMWGTVNLIDLRTVDLETVSNSYCRSLVDSAIYPSQICAYGGTGKGVCNKENGGPLIVDGTLVGIFSWGKPCVLGVPDVYVRVSEYFDWIYKNII